MKLHKISRLLIIAFSLTALGSCGGGEGNKSEDTEVVAMKNEVMRIHDEVMPKMGTVKSLQSKLAAMTEDSTAQAIASDLGSAHDDMMLWMKNYKEPAADMEKEKALEYLGGQEEQVQQVKDAINNSIEAAENYLNNN